MIASVVDEFGGLHIAVNNAGRGHLPTPLHELEVESFDQIMAIDARGVFLCLKFAIAQMVRDGVPGAIVNTASGTGLKASKGLSGYVTAKHAVVGLTRNAAIDYASAGIRVNAVAPGATATPMMYAQPPELLEEYRSRMPSGRFAETAEVAAPVAWLLSDEASYVSGDIIEVDFGYMQSG